MSCNTRNSKFWSDLASQDDMNQIYKKYEDKMVAYEKLKSEFDLKVVYAIQTEMELSENTLSKTLEWSNGTLSLSDYKKFLTKIEMI